MMKNRNELVFSAFSDRVQQLLIFHFCDNKNVNPLTKLKVGLGWLALGHFPLGVKANFSLCTDLYRTLEYRNYKRTGEVQWSSGLEGWLERRNLWLCV